MFDPSGVSLWGHCYRALTHTAIQVKPLRARQISYADPLQDISSQWAWFMRGSASENEFLRYEDDELSRSSFVRRKVNLCFFDK